MSRRRVECCIAEGLGCVVTNDIILCRVDSVLISAHVSVDAQSSTYKVGLYRGKLRTISCLAFMESSTCLTALRDACTPCESVSASTDVEEAASTSALASP